MTTMREPLHLVATPTYWPRGIECILDYDDSAVVLNDLRRADQIVVEAIGGLGDPDLAASAEKDPDRDGETPQDSTYGGRTITLRGYIQAGSLDKLRERFSYLKDGFDDIAEAPLWFRYLDWRDPFTDSGALVDYAYDAGTGTVQIASDGTGLQPTSTANKAIRILPLKNDGTSPSRFTYGDGEAILKFRAGTSITGVVAGIEFRRTSSLVKLRVVYEKATDTLRLYKINTSTTQLATVASTTLVVGTDYWIRARAEGSVISFSLWSTYPPDIGGTPLATQTHTLSAGDLILYPASTSGLGWGLYWTPNSTTDRIKLLDVGALNPGDAVIWCRKAVPIDPGDETQVGYEWRRSFLITLRASSDLMVARKVTKVTLSPPSTPVLQIYYATALTNYGRSPTTMIVKFNGQHNKPRIYLPSTGKVLGLGSIIGNLDSSHGFENSLELDTSTRTVVNNLNNSSYYALSDETTWPKLPRGSNELRITAEKFDDFYNATLASALNGRVTTNLGTWATAGSTTDLVATDTVTWDSSESFMSMMRSTTADSGNGRICNLSLNNYTDARVDLIFRFNLAFSTTVSNLSRIGILARYVNSTNYLMVSVSRHFGGSLTYYISATRVVAGAANEIQTESITYPLPLINTWYMLSLTMRSNGRLLLELRDPTTGSLINSTSEIYGDIDTAATWPTVDSSLATAGALATGKIGIVDYNQSALAITRYYGKLSVASAIDSGTIDITYRSSSR